MPAEEAHATHPSPRPSSRARRAARPVAARRHRVRRRRRAPAAARPTPVRPARCPTPSTPAAVADTDIDGTTITLVTHDSFAVSDGIFDTFTERDRHRRRGAPERRRRHDRQPVGVHRRRPGRRRDVRHRQHVPVPRARRRRVRALRVTGAGRRARRARARPEPPRDADRRRRRVRQLREGRVRRRDAAGRPRRPDRPDVRRPVRHREPRDVVARLRVPARDDREVRRGRVGGLLDRACATTASRSTNGWEEAYTEAFAGGKGDRPIVTSYASSPVVEVLYSDPPVDERAHRRGLRRVLPPGRVRRRAAGHASTPRPPRSSSTSCCRRPSRRTSRSTCSSSPANSKAALPDGLPAVPHRDRRAAHARPGDHRGRPSRLDRAVDADRPAVSAARRPHGRRGCVVGAVAVPCSSRCSSPSRSRRSSDAGLDDGGRSATCSARSSTARRAVVHVLAGRGVDCADAGRRAARGVGLARFDFPARRVLRARAGRAVRAADDRRRRRPAGAVRAVRSRRRRRSASREQWPRSCSPTSSSTSPWSSASSAATGRCSIPRAEEAARMLGAVALARAARGHLPRLAPAIWSAGVIVFLFCFTSFGVILTVGGPGQPTLETEIWRYADPAHRLPDRGRARGAPARRGRRAARGGRRASTGARRGRAPGRRPVAPRAARGRTPSAPRSSPRSPRRSCSSSLPLGVLVERSLRGPRRLRPRQLPRARPSDRHRGLFVPPLEAVRQLAPLRGRRHRDRGRRSARSRPWSSSTDDAAAACSTSR